MNFYKHHIGDYAAATAHLSFTEDAAFSRLLRIYYRDERPLPVELRAVQRLAGARSPDELEAVEIVLNEFFRLAEDGWHNKRCDEEIAKAQSQAETNRCIAEAREARRRATIRQRTEHESCNESLNHSSPSREPSQTPDSRHQKPSQAKATATAPSAKRGQRLPLDWQPSDDDVTFAVEMRVDWRREVEAFRDYWWSKPGAQAVKLDWSATWRNWIRRCTQKPAVKQEPVKSQTYSGLEKLAGIAHGTVDRTGSGNGARQAHLLEAAGLPRLGHGRDDGFDLD